MTASCGRAGRSGIDPEFISGAVGAYSPTQSRFFSGVGIAQIKHNISLFYTCVNGLLISSIPNHFSIYLCAIHCDAIEVNSAWNMVVIPLDAIDSCGVVFMIQKCFYQATL